VVVACGQHLVVLLGGLDLSTASVMTLGGILTFAWIGGPFSLLWVAPTVLLITGLIGAANGIGVSVFGIPSFIMTLATGMIVAGAVLGFTQGVPHGLASPALAALFTAKLLGIPLVVFATLALVALGSVMQQRTAFGRRIYAIGTNRDAAYLAGVPVRRETVLCYALSAAAAGLAGILMVGYASGATLTMGQAYLLPPIAAVVLGGTSIAGGRGTLPGTAAAGVLLTAITTLTSALSLHEGWRTILYGCVILAAVVVLRAESYRSLAWRTFAPLPSKGSLG
ncbi:MAG: ABC transporter permease, partial [Candidatus Eremiobacteraeota bacterium]|nr:ABC transporter permease [Candidatus Eremiobacteraeota bacterium]